MALAYRQLGGGSGRGCLRSFCFLLLSPVAVRTACCSRVPFTFSYPYSLRNYTLVHGDGISNCVRKR